MNKAESQRIASYLNSAGHHEVKSPWEADLVVLNTCVVRQSAEGKVLGMLGQLKGIKREHPDIRILVTGCFVDSHVEDLKKRFPHVDFFFKPGAYSDFINWAKEQGVPVDEQRLLRGARNDAGKDSSPCAYIPIIQGCNNFCSFCIVPYRRGKEVSRPVDEVVCEAEELVRQGVKEITLLGQNVDSYGRDLPERPDLADLLYRLSEIEGLLRIRFLTNHPKDVSRKLIEAVVSLDKVCKYLELPVQSGDDAILKAMKRGYTIEQYRELVRAVRERLPQASLSTDVIVGFPGETEEQFEHTFSLLKEVRFDVVHVAAYSPRSGTLAWRKYEDSVPLDVKKERLRKVEQLQASVAGEINSSYVGKEVEVLVEGNKKGKWYGRTESNKLVFFQEDANCSGKLVKVNIEKTSPWALQGKHA
ncbi:tRNA-2-methylthio-N(6)-dimethylallyladenosine synthase [subsurface metagenome]